MKIKILIEDRTLGHAVNYDLKVDSLHKAISYATNFFDTYNENGNFDIKVADSYTNQKDTKFLMSMKSEKFTFTFNRVRKK